MFLRHPLLPLIITTKQMKHAMFMDGHFLSLFSHLLWLCHQVPLGRSKERKDYKKPFKMVHGYRQRILFGVNDCIFWIISTVGYTQCLG